LGVRAAIGLTGWLITLARVRFIFFEAALAQSINTGVDWA